MLILDTVYVASDITCGSSQPLFHLQGVALLVTGTVHPKMKIMSLITHPHVVPIPNLQDIRSSSEHKCKYNFYILRVLRPSIDSKGPYTIKVQKLSKDIGKIIRDIRGSTVILRSYENTFCMQRKQK